MYDFAIAWDWLSFAARWLHVITAIAWIGSSFYFIALDLGLRQRPGLPEGAFGEEWQVHGGGFYHIQKYLVAPAEMPEHLTWFKWESYMTWISGFALMAIVYYAGADLFLIDPAVLDISAPVAILISIASLAFGWIAYDFACKAFLGKSDTLLMVFLYVVLVLMAWGYTHVFTGRGQGSAHLSGGREQPRKGAGEISRRAAVQPDNTATDADRARQDLLSRRRAHHPGR